MRKALILLFIFVFGLSGAQEKEDLKVGLVLSGGGAKGLAHIGVLKEIEKAGVKIDYVAGTSMGAIVGGLYASGYNATQLDSIFREVDFDSLIQDNLPREAKTFFEKDDAERYAITLPFKNFKISIPSALSKGQNTYNLFSRLLEHVSNVEDFSQLPIPFFCVATDVERGEQVILDSGYLPRAISASGALPSVFSPVQLDDRILIDGGVVNNYPVQELRDRGADFIIGVDVQDDLRSREELRSAPEILIQINNYRTIRDMQEKMNLTDIYIKPDITGFTVVDFNRGEAIIEGGEKKAKEFSEELKALAENQQKGYYNKPPLNIERSDSLTIAGISIEGNSYYTRSYILGKIKIKPPSSTSYKKFFRGINNLAATGNFQRIDHELDRREDGSYLLRLKVVENENTTYLRAGLHYDDLYKSGALVNLLKKRVIFRNDVISLDAVLGDNIRYELDYYSDNGFYISFGFRALYNSFEKRVNASFVRQISDVPLEGFNNISAEYSDFTNQLYVQTLFEKQFSLDLGIEHKYLNIETQTLTSSGGNSDHFYFENSNFYSAYGKLRLDTFDQRYFPTSGWYFNGDFHAYIFSSDFNNEFTKFSIGRATLKYATPVLPNVSMLLQTEGGFKIGGDRVNSLDFYLGGWGNNLVNNLVPFYGYDFISVAGDGYVKAHFSFDYNFYRRNHLNIGANFANIENKLFSSGSWLSAPDYTGYYLGYGLETFLGPLQTKISYSPELDETFWYFSLGFWF